MIYLKHRRRTKPCCFAGRGTIRPHAARPAGGSGTKEQRSFHDGTNERAPATIWNSHQDREAGELELGMRRLAPLVVGGLADPGDCAATVHRPRSLFPRLRPLEAQSTPPAPPSLAGKYLDITLQSKTDRPSREEDVVTDDRVLMDRDHRPASPGSRSNNPERRNAYDPRDARAARSRTSTSSPPTTTSRWSCCGARAACSAPAPTWPTPTRGTATGGDRRRIEGRRRRVDGRASAVAWASTARRSTSTTSSSATRR